MSNPSKAKGTRAETRVTRYLTEHGLPAERRALAGSSDRGDLKVTTPQGELTIEVKAGTQTANYGRRLFEKWKDQTIAEMRNCKVPGVLVIVRHQRPLSNAEVWLPTTDSANHEGRPHWIMMYLDEFVEWMMGG